MGDQVVRNCPFPWLFANRVRCVSMFLILDFLIYLDRGILPGAHEEVLQTLMLDRYIRRNPELYFGLLQSVFVAGLAFSAPALSYLAARRGYPLRYLMIGLVVWMFSLAGCACSSKLNSPWMLFIFRAISGAGEGAFVSLMAPMLLDACDITSHGFMLGIFFALMPAGAACGFIFSSATVSKGFHWSTCFTILTALSTIPIFGCVIFASSTAGESKTPLRHLKPEEEILSVPLTPMRMTTTMDPDQSPRYRASSRKKAIVDSSRMMSPLTGERVVANECAQSSFRNCIYELLGSPVFASLLLCGASYAAVTASLSSFGSAFLLDLGLFETELAASSVLGVIGACAGALGTVIGGFMVTTTTQHRRNTGNTGDPRPTGNTGDPRPTGNSDPKLTRFARALRATKWKEEKQEDFLKRTSMVENWTERITKPGMIASFLAMACPICLIHNVPGSIALALLATGVLSMATLQSGLNLCVMASAPSLYRSLAVSVFGLGLHLFGDVPGPIFVGYMKDKMAPHCRPPKPALSLLNSVINLQLKDECARERMDLLIVLLVFLSWTNFTWIGLFLAKSFSSWTLSSSEKNVYSRRALSTP